MVSPLSANVVIECPHCGMRYQLPSEAIGPRGRQVACAHCGRTWHAKARAPDPTDEADRIFDEAEEGALDAAFAAEEKAAAAASPPPAPVADTAPDGDRRRLIADIRAAIAPKPRAARPRSAEPRLDAAGQKKRLKDFDKRQLARSRQLPLAKVRRAVRLGAVSALAGLIVCGVAFRTDIVRQYPDLAGVYEALGLGVNVTGLEFRDVTTLVTLRNGARVMRVDARIYSVAAHGIEVPPVVVTLLDDGGTPLYEWSIRPDVQGLEPGETIDFTTQLSAPPLAATRVRLTFTDGRGRTEGPVAQATTPST